MRFCFVMLWQTRRGASRRRKAMARRIEKDRTRFRDIVRGKIKQNLRRFMQRGELIGRKGDKTVSVPLPQIQLPRFTYGDNSGGVGSGDGEEGDILDAKPQEGPQGVGEAGENPGEHVLEVDVSLAELAEILGEELELPNIEPKGQNVIVTEKDKYSGIRRVGPQSLRHVRRTFREALQREITSGTYDADDPVIVPQKADMRYRSWQTRALPESSAVIIYMMDVSGSMGEEQKEIVRIEAFWIDTWLRSQYKNIESVYIVHDAAAREVDEHTFYHLRESGGTKISSAYELCAQILDQRFPVDEWNIYPFHFSDGDNWGTDDTDRCIELLNESIFPASNMFCYGQVRSAYGSGKFKGELESRLGADHDKLITSDIPDRDGILPSIKTFLGRGA
jgi:sporulation protein YhbH